jgi:hypothetical protein
VCTLAPSTAVAFWTVVLQGSRSISIDEAVKAAEVQRFDRVLDGIHNTSTIRFGEYNLYSSSSDSSSSSSIRCSSMVVVIGRSC